MVTSAHPRAQKHRSGIGWETIEFGDAAKGSLPAETHIFKRFEAFANAVKVGRAQSSFKTFKRMSVALILFATTRTKIGLISLAHPCGLHTHPQCRVQQMSNISGKRSIDNDGR